MGFARGLPVAFLLSGVLLTAYSLATGTGHLVLFLIIPVVTGDSPAFLGGVVLLIAGVLTLPMAFEGPAAESPGSTALRTERNGSGGVILLGPLPILFGSARSVSRRTYWLLMVVGIALAGLSLFFFFR